MITLLIHLFLVWRLIAESTSAAAASPQRFPLIPLYLLFKG